MSQDPNSDNYIFNHDREWLQKKMGTRYSKQDLLDSLPTWSNGFLNVLISCLWVKDRSPLYPTSQKDVKINIIRDFIEKGEQQKMLIEYYYMQQVRDFY
jgi:hypothetical protein